MPVHNHLFFSPIAALGHSLSERFARERYLLRGEGLEMSLPLEGLGLIHQIHARGLPNWNDEGEYVRLDERFEQAWAQTPHGLDFIPDPELIARLRELATQHAATLAFFLNHERGDNLYDQYAWVFEHTATPSAQGLKLKERLYCMDAHYEPYTFEGAALTPCPTPDLGTTANTPMAKLLRHFGVERGMGYFPPDDYASFDLEPYRWA